jgi:hypothetical protein
MKSKKYASQLAKASSLAANASMVATSGSVGSWGMILVRIASTLASYSVSSVMPPERSWASAARAVVQVHRVDNGLEHEAEGIDEHKAPGARSPSWPHRRRVGHPAQSS